MIVAALRRHRRGIVGYGLAMGLYGFVQSYAFKQAAGSTEAARLAFGRDMAALGAQLSYLLPLPVQVGTLSGYVGWRVYGFFAILIAVWAVAAAAGAGPGDEEAGLVDQWLAAGVPRRRLAVSRVVAFGAASATAATLAAVATDLGGASSLGQLDPSALAQQTLSLIALGTCLFALAYVVAQVTGSRRSGAGLAAAAVGVLFFLNSLGRTAGGLRTVREVSPFRWYDRSNPLTPGGHADWAALLTLLLVASALTVLAAALFGRRDVGSPLLRLSFGERGGRRAAGPLLRIPVLRGLARQRWGLLAWLIAVALLAVLMVNLSKSVVDGFKGVAAIQQYLAAAGGGEPHRAYVSVVWFGIAQALVAAYAIFQVSGWAAEDADGELEAVLSQPVARWAVVGERCATLVAGIGLLSLVGALACGLAAGAAGIGLDAAAVARASWLLVPFALAFAAAGAVGVGAWPRATVALLAFLALASYLLNQLSPFMGWPAWVADLSVFRLYGTPLTSGVYWRGLIVLLTIGVAGFGAGAVLMQRRDVGR